MILPCHENTTKNTTEFISGLMDNNANLTSYENIYKTNLVKLNVIYALKHIFKIKRGNII